MASDLPINKIELTTGNLDFIKAGKTLNILEDVISFQSLMNGEFDTNTEPKYYQIKLLDSELNLQDEKYFTHMEIINQDLYNKTLELQKENEQLKNEIEELSNQIKLILGEFKNQ